MGNLVGSCVRINNGRDHSSALESCEALGSWVYFQIDNEGAGATHLVQAQPINLLSLFIESWGCICLWCFRVLTCELGVAAVPTAQEHLTKL